MYLKLSLIKNKGIITSVETDVCSYLLGAQYMQYNQWSILSIQSDYIWINGAFQLLGKTEENIPALTFATATQKLACPVLSLLYGFDSI